MVRVLGSQSRRVNRLTLTRAIQNGASGNYVTPPALVDYFTRADNATSLGSTPAGEAWTPGGYGSTTGWGVLSNKAAMGATTNGESYAWLPCAFANGFIEADITLSPVRSSVGFIFRAASITGTGTQSRILMRMRKQAAADNIDLYVGGYTLLAQNVSSGLALNTTYHVKVTFSGTALEVFVDGVSKLTYSTTTGHELRTNHGLCVFYGSSDDDGQSRIDNFRAVPG